MLQFTFCAKVRYLHLHSLLIKEMFMISCIDKRKQIGVHFTGHRSRRGQMTMTAMMIIHQSIEATSSIVSLSISSESDQMLFYSYLRVICARNYLFLLSFSHSICRSQLRTIHLPAIATSCDVATASSLGNSLCVVDISCDINIQRHDEYVCQILVSCFVSHLFVCFLQKFI